MCNIHYPTPTSLVLCGASITFYKGWQAPYIPSVGTIALLECSRIFFSKKLWLTRTCTWDHCLAGKPGLKVSFIKRRHRVPFLKWPEISGCLCCKVQDQHCQFLPQNKTSPHDQWPTSMLDCCDVLPLAGLTTNTHKHNNNNNMGYLHSSCHQMLGRSQLCMSSGRSLGCCHRSGHIAYRGSASTHLYLSVEKWEPLDNGQVPLDISYRPETHPLICTVTFTLLTKAKSPFSPLGPTPQLCTWSCRVGVFFFKCRPQMEL